MRDGEATNDLHLCGAICGMGRCLMNVGRRDLDVSGMHHEVVSRLDNGGSS